MSTPVDPHDNPVVQPGNQPAQSEHPIGYVGIGASAGGLEAIEIFFKKMPKDSGLTFIVIQHLSPTHKSMMVELLSRHTEMPVKQVVDGLVTEPNHIYLIPPNHNLKIFNGTLLIAEQTRTDGNISLPIDIFFKSLAEDQNEKAIGIVLSGTGSDGARGLQAIKENHGMVMVQSVESSRFDGMPRNAIATGLVDFVLAPEEMPDQLMQYVTFPQQAAMRLTKAAPPSEDGLTRVFALLREKTSVDFTLYKPNTILRRIERRMMINQMNALNDYIRLLENSSSELNTLYRELLIGVTSFFRDPKAYDALASDHIPKLLSNPQKTEFRIWVAGCSTGEEAYSLAMLCRNIVGQSDRKIDVKIFATDVDRDTITRAGSGLFHETAAADIPADLLSKYLYRQDSQLRVVKEVREMVIFAQHNLVKDPPFTNIDMVSCRNLLIYLQPVLQKKVMELFNFSLNQDGLLFLGNSETIGDMTDYFKPIDNKYKIYYSRGKRKLTGLLTEPNLTRHTTLLNSGSYRSEGRFNYRAHEEERIVERFLQGLSGEYVPLSMIVNEDLELLYVLGDTEGFFRIPSGKIQNKLTKMAVDDLAIPLSTGLQKAFSRWEEVVYTNIYLSGQKIDKSLRIRIRPLPKKKGQDALVAVLIETEDLEHLAHPAIGTQSEQYDVGKEAQQRIRDLEQALQFNRENLQATVEELETSNEELQASNEELMASNEELQSTNEELQSVNEELYTVNSEYQSKIIDLTEANNDLENLYASTGIAMAFLDENLDIRKFTPNLKEIFELIDSDIGRPLANIAHRLQDIDPLPFIRDVNKNSRLFEREVTTRDGVNYLMRILPYNIAKNVFSGATLSFIEIDSLKQTQQKLMRSEFRNEVALDILGMGSWEWNLETNELMWSKSLEPMFGFTNGEFPGTFEAFFERIHPDDRSKVEAAIQSAIAQDEDYRIEHRVILPNGKLRWIAEHGRLVCMTGASRSQRMFGLARDITGEKTAEELSA